MSKLLRSITNGPERSAADCGDRVKAVGKSATRAAPLPSPVRVVLLAGDPVTHTIFRSHLTAHEPDWHLDAYTHGEPAWRALRATPPQLVLLEQTLPDGCGLGLIQK